MLYFVYDVITKQVCPK